MSLRPHRDVPPTTPGCPSGLTGMSPCAQGDMKPCHFGPPGPSSRGQGPLIETPGPLVENPRRTAAATSRPPEGGTPTACPARWSPAFRRLGGAVLRAWTELPGRCHARSKAVPALRGSTESAHRNALTRPGRPCYGSFCGLKPENLQGKFPTGFSSAYR